MSGVQASELFTDARDHPGPLLGAADVSCDCDAANLGCGRVGLVSVDVYYRNSRTKCSELARRGEADARSPSGDQSDLVLEGFHSLPP